jgi:RNA polymerase-binding transcription factor DksA
MTGYQMSNFKSLLRRWKRHGSSRGSNSENKMQISNGRIQEVNDHQSGAQGHALQVNGHPQQSDDLDNDYEG